MNQYMIASLIPEESTLGRAISSVRSVLQEREIPFRLPKPKYHISYLPPFWASEDFAEGLAKGLRFCKVYDTEASIAILRVVGHDYFGENGRALAVELECGPALKEVVEDLRASIKREWWVHDPDNYLFRPHATIAHDDNLRTNASKVSNLGQYIPMTPIRLPTIRLLKKNEVTGRWGVCHF